MKNNTQGNGSQQGCISQTRRLSFYEENYILEPEDCEKDNGYLNYESDDTQELDYSHNSYQLAM